MSYHKCKLKRDLAFIIVQYERVNNISLGKIFKRNRWLYIKVFCTTAFPFCELCFDCFATLGSKGKTAEHILIWKSASVNFWDSLREVVIIQYLIIAGSTEIKEKKESAETNYDCLTVWGTSKNKLFLCLRKTVWTAALYTFHFFGVC